MRLSSRSFPHPVVGHADDVPEAAFQATPEFRSDRTNYYLKVTVACSSRTLLNMIAKGTACYTLHVECGNTLFRRSYDFTDSVHEITIAASLLNDTVEVIPFIRARKAVSGYVVEGSHEDYGEAAFSIKPGDILAIGDGQVFDADNSVDPLRRVGALMEVVQPQEAGDHPMRADTSRDKIRILLCESDYVAYRDMRAVPNLTTHLTTTLVLPMLMQAVTLLEADDGQLEGYKWASILRGRLDQLDAGSATDTLAKAQLLLDLPIRRALSSAKELKNQLAGSGE